MKSQQPSGFSLSELAQLTQRANVAFAVRCAQRLRPRFQLPNDAPHRREQIAAVDAAIRVAAAFCQGTPLEEGRAAAAARTAGAVAEETCETTSFAAYAAVRAAEAAAYAEEAVRTPCDSAMTEIVAAAFGAGRVVAANIDTYGQERAVFAMCADVHKLLGIAQGPIDSLGAPIDPSENGPLGPLWPTGAPAGFAAEA